MLTNVLAVSAASWGLVMALAPLLQLRRMARRRSSGDLSLGYYLVLIPGFALWAAYGCSSRNLALVVPNGVALAIHVTLVVVAARLRRRWTVDQVNRAES